MLLKTYSRRLFRAECNPRFESLHCIAALDQDVSAALPYLNSALGGFEYLADPPAVTFRHRGRLITVQGREIAINALADEAEADRILDWLKREINDCWENRADIVPSTRGAPRIQIFEILKRLPRTNCRLCGEPTCMVFASKLIDGAKEPRDCAPLEGEALSRLQDYVGKFQLDE
jgi:ArsR family metal-binding transcriptional regulator